MLGSARIRWQSASHPIALMSLMYYYHSFVVCRYDETESAGCEFPHKVHTHSNLCVCAYVEMFIHLSTRL